MHTMVTLLRIRRRTDGEMASQFHDVLRDFALEKMKEMEHHDASHIEDQKSRVESPDHTEKGDRPQTSSKGRKQGKHSKDSSSGHHTKDSHSHKSKKKDRKSSSSSSRRKKKSKKKSSSHHRSRHHKRKDREQVRNSGADTIKGVDESLGDEGTSIAKDDSGSGEDTNAVIQVASEEDSSSGGESEPGSVSPPLQLGKDFLEGLLQETDQGMSGATDDSKDLIDVDGDTALHEIMALRKAKKKAGLDLLSKTREMIIRRCGLEEKKPDGPNEKKPGAGLEAKHDVPKVEEKSGLLEEKPGSHKEKKPGCLHGRKLGGPKEKKPDGLKRGKSGSLEEKPEGSKQKKSVGLKRMRSDGLEKKLEGSKQQTLGTVGNISQVSTLKEIVRKEIAGTNSSTKSEQSKDVVAPAKFRSQGSTSNDIVKEEETMNNSLIESEHSKDVDADAPENLIPKQSQAASEASSSLSRRRLLQGQLRKEVDTHDILPDEHATTGDNSLKSLKTVQVSNSELVRTLSVDSLSEPHSVCSLPDAAVVEVLKSDQGKSPIEQETKTDKTSSVDLQNDNTDHIIKVRAPSGSSHKERQGTIGKSEGTSGTVDADTGNGRDAKKSQSIKPKTIQIKISTFELPTDPTEAGTDEAGKKEDISEEEGIDGDSDGDAPTSDKPWRIVPEEGELTPSTDGDEGHELLEKALEVTGNKEAAGKLDSKGSKDPADSSSRKHRKSKKRKKDNREEGEISDKKKKKRRRHKSSDRSKERDSENTEKDGKRDSRSKSSDRKRIKSSVVKTDSSRAVPQRSRSRSRNRSRSRSPGFRKSGSPGQHRRSRSPGYRRSRSRSRSPISRRGGGSGGGFDLRDKLSRRRKGGRSRSRSRERNRRERSYTPVEEIDKKKLLEIAKANAYLYQKVASGDLPANTPFPQIDSRLGGGRTVHELTEVCKNLSKKGDEESSDEEAVNLPVNSDDEGLIRHPFQVKERPLSITMNIQNAIPMPIQTSKEMLRVQFPVSSGTKHREKADTLPEGPFGSWEPVKKPEPAKPAPPTAVAGAASGTPSATTTTPAAGTPVVLPPGSTPLPVAPPVPPAPVPEEHKVFEENPRQENVNLADVIAMRLKAARQLQTNPLDMEALTSMHKAQSRLRTWANKDQKPGLFTGKNDATMLTPAELANPNPKNQAWAKKDMFHNHLPVRGGIGMQLLQKMGWKQGEGLGKYKEGSTQPLLLDVKTDRKGLAVKSEAPRRSRFSMAPNNRNQRVARPPPAQAPTMDLTGKHPVSALNELCSKRKWPQPQYIVLRDVGPAHKKEFIFKVNLNGEEFTGAMACNNKKEAKALAAQTALVKLGLVPSTSAS